MAKVDVFNLKREKVGEIDLSDAVFATEVREHLFYEVVKAQLASARQGTAAAKNRSAVSGSTKKLYKQKGTGRARAGDAKSPTRVGGGVAFGPHPRDYGYKVQRKVKRKALTSALSDRAGAERVTVVEDLRLDTPKTSKMAALFAAMELPGRHTLFVVEADGNTIWKSTRNLRGVRVLRSSELNAYIILWADNVVFTQKALAGAEEVFGK